MTPLSRRQLLAGAAAATVVAPGIAAESPVAKFKLGTVTYNLFAATDLDTTLAICKDTGLASVEFRTTHKHGVEPSLTKDQRREVRKKCADSGVAISGCGSVCEFHAASPQVVRDNIETCKRFVELTADIGGRGVKVRPNGFVKDVPQEQTLRQIGEALIECGKAAESAGIEIQVEVHGRGTAEPRHIKTIMDHCKHKAVGITWNSNPEDVKDGSVAEAFKLLWPYVKNCHINQLWKDSTKAYPYRELFRLFREQGYTGYTLIELGKGFTDVESTKEFVRYYKALWTELCRG